MLTYEAIVARTPWLTYPRSVDPEHFRAALYADPQGEQVRWKQAFIDPSFDPSATDPAAGKARYAYTEARTGTYRAVVAGEQVIRRYLPNAQTETGDLVVTTMQDELPLTDHDLLIPMGRNPRPINYEEDARTFVYKQTLTRGAERQSLSGSVQSLGAEVTGIGCAFTTDFAVGDILEAAKTSLRIVAISGDNTLTLESAPSPAWRQNAYFRRYERLTKDTAQRLRDARSGSAGHFTLYTDTQVKIGPDAHSLVWPGGIVSPAPGVTFSVAYDYYPVYEVREDLGVHRHVTAGRLMAQTVVCRLWTPDTHRA